MVGVHFSSGGTSTCRLKLLQLVNPKPHHQKYPTYTYLLVLIAPRVCSACPRSLPPHQRALREKVKNVKRQGQRQAREVEDGRIEHMHD